MLEVLAPKSKPEGEGGKERLAELLSEAKENFKLAEDWWKDNRALWLEDAKFRAGGHWPDTIRKEREADKLPCLVMDKLRQYVRQVVNDGRQNRPGVKVSPVEDGDVAVAKAYMGIVRDILDKSNADEAFDTALDHATSNGFGFYRVLTEYAHEGTFNQEIRVRRIRNALTVLLDPHIQLADGSDACFGFVIDEVPKDDFSKRYPKAKQTDWDFDSKAYGDGWLTDKNVRVCEYWYKVEVLSKLHLLANGDTASDEEYQAALAELGPEKVPQVVETREVPSYRVKWCRLTGAEVLEERDWPGKYIPLLIVLGDEEDIDGKVTYSGLIRWAKDPQRLYNYMRSKFAERVALAPQSPWLVAEEATDDHPEWDSANSGKHGTLKFKAFDEQDRALPTPQRVQPADVPAGFAQDMQISEHDVQGALGMYNASLGEKSNEKSGKAIMARQREGDTSTFHYHDNLNRSIRLLGRILVDLIPKVLDSKRVVRLLGEDGSPEIAEIDPGLDAPSRKVGARMVYNLGVGRYDVSLSAGASYTTKRQESAEAMLEMASRDPSMWRTHGDLIAKAQDWPDAEAFAERSKLAMPPEMRAAVDDGTDLPPEAKTIKAQADMALQEKDQQLAAAEQIVQQLQEENASLKAKAENKTADSVAKLKDAATDEYRAETERVQALAPAITPESIAAIVRQTVIEVLGSAPPPAADPGGGGLMPPQPPEAPPGAFFAPGAEEPLQ